jgi:hypothetical protein
MSDRGAIRGYVAFAIVGIATGVGAALAFPHKPAAPAAARAATRPDSHASAAPSSRRAEAAGGRAPARPPAPKSQESEMRLRLSHAERIWKDTKPAKLEIDPYWNPKKIDLDEAQLQALEERLKQLLAPVEAARSNWMGSTGQTFDRAHRNGQFTRTVASPPGRPVSMLEPQRLDPDQAMTSGSVGNYAFNLSYSFVFTPAEYPALGEMKRTLNRRYLDLHDGVQQFFADAAKGR